MRSVMYVCVLPCVLLFLPATASAQAVITGVVKDTSGGVLPGVTVEATSPALIEKVRSGVSDETGQYRIVALPPGTYSVTFTLPGFSTVKRDGIELSGSFVATVNGDLKVGALEETITVTGETPIVDVQSAKVQQTVNKDILAAIPSSRTAIGIQSLIPGMSNSGDSGGLSGQLSTSTGQIHGGRSNDSRTLSEGLSTGWAGGGNGQGNMPNVGGAQEVVISTSGGLGEAETAGVTLNVIPRDGGNTFSGTVFASGANGAMQGSNYTQALKDAGLRTPSELLKLWDINPMWGGRIVRDRLWFYLFYRETRSDNTVPGMWVNRNAGNPNAWTVDFDLSRQAFSDALNRNGIGRITWQATPRNKISVSWSEQFTHNFRKGGGRSTETIEATGRVSAHPNRIQQVSYSSPVSGRLLVEAGWVRWEDMTGNGIPRIDGTHNPLMVRVTEQSGSIPGLSSRMPTGSSGGFSRNYIGTYSNMHASLSYVTGTNNMKFGYQGGFNNPVAAHWNSTPFFGFRFNNGVPNELTQTMSYPQEIRVQTYLIPTGLYAQNQWTSGRLTLQGGVRYDHGVTNFPDAAVGGWSLLATRELRYPAGSTQGISWHDVTPRMGVAYDLFGSGKTAVKFNLGKYMEANAKTSSTRSGELDLHPLRRIVTSTPRPWTDTNKDFVPNCDLRNPEKNGECGAMENKNFGKEVFSTNFDPNYVTGWGVRPYNWSLGVSVQQEVLPRVSLNVGYFRNWWGNWYGTDNRATSLADYTPFSIRAPVDPRLPGDGGYTVSGLYDLVPSKVGQVDDLVQAMNNFAKTIENWQGVDVTFSTRLRNGLTVQGGSSTGRRLLDRCAARAVVPELGSLISVGTASLTNPYCRVVEPYQTQIRGLATYTIPKVDLQVSGTWQSNPGPELAANYVVNSAVIAAGPQPLGRVLSGGANVTVNLIPAGTLYAVRRNNFDFRVSKILRYGRTRTQVGVDIYNVTNTDVVTSYNQTFRPNGSWLTPTGIQPARYAKVSAQVDF